MKHVMLTALMAGTLLITGCEGSRVGLYATIPPPPLRVETYGPAPGPGYIWINGFWGFSGGRYVWNGGRWARPPRGRRNWEAGRWEQRGDRYRWHEGHWR